MGSDRLGREILVPQTKSNSGTCVPGLQGTRYRIPPATLAGLVMDSQVIMLRPAFLFVSYSMFWEQSTDDPE